MKVSAKMLGDAGEHYALSQFTLAGFPASKMPENWVMTWPSSRVMACCG